MRIARAFDRRVGGALTSAWAGRLALAALAAWSTPAVGQEASARFDINAFDVKGNTVLAPRDVEKLVYPHMGPGKTPADVEAARAALQTAFQDRGYASVAVSIPEQSIDSGIIRLEVTEARIGKVVVAGGSRTSEAWVRERAPALAPGTVPNFNEVQKDIVALNQSADRRVTPEVKPGEAPDTVDVALTVEDKSPFHGSVELNNFGSAATKPLRVVSTLRYDDLWGAGHSISLSTQFSPERTSDTQVISGNYLARIGKLQLLAYGVYSNSDISVVGGTNVIGRGTLGGVRLIVPLTQGETFFQSVTAGIDYKDFGEDIRLGENRDSAPIAYAPASISWRGDWTGERGKADFTLAATLGLRGLSDSSDVFRYKRLNAKPNFFYIRGEGGVTAELPDGWQLYTHAATQWAGEPLISNEQFSLGGMDTVRGFFESEALGDFGLAGQLELRTPDLGGILKPVTDSVRFNVFVDGGVAGIIDPLPDQHRLWRLAAAGAGLDLEVFDYWRGVVSLAVPLTDGPDSTAGSLVARFRILGEF